MTQLKHDAQARADGLTTMDLGQVLPLTAELRAGHLVVGGVDMVQLAREQGTALYVMDVAHIKNQLRAYQAALGAGAIVAFAGKAFLNIAMARLLAAEHCHLDVSGGGELAIALAAGFDPAQIIVHGNNKTQLELSEAVAAKVGLVVVDCAEELQRLSRLATAAGAEQAILLRIKPGVVAATHQFVVTGAEDSKFGFGISDGMAQQAVQQALELPGLRLKGLHVHIGSQIFEFSAYGQALLALVDLVQQLKAGYGYAPEIIDIGGGLGSAYAAGDEPPAIADFGAFLTKQLQAGFTGLGLAIPQLIVEPGRSIVANAGVTLYTLGSIKDLKDIRCYVAVDGGMSDNIRPALYDAHYEAVIANKAEFSRDKLVTLVGKHCESGDFIASDASIQVPAVGDIVAVLATGAYNATMSSNYNAQVRPAVVFVEDGVATVVQRRETYADLMARDMDF